MRLHLRLFKGALWSDHQGMSAPSLLRPARCAVWGAFGCVFALLVNWSICFAERSTHELSEMLPSSTPGYASAAIGVDGFGASIGCIEPTVDCGPSQNRLVIIAGLDGKKAGTAASLEFIRWWFSSAGESPRKGWQIAVVPSVFGVLETAPAVSFPPVKGFFNDPQNPASRYVWRWAAMTAPDLVVDLREASSMVCAVNTIAKEFFPESEAAAADELAGALGVAAPSGLAPVPAVRFEGNADVLVGGLRQIVSRNIPKSALRREMELRISREPLEIARVLAARYPASGGMSYIPALAWSGALRVSRLTGDPMFRDRAVSQMQPFLSGEKPALGKSPGLPAVAGHLAFSDWAAAERREDAAALARVAADSLIAPGDSSQVVPYATRWTDDMFMASSVLSRVAGSSGEAMYAAAVQRLLTTYSERLQQPNGVFVHVETSPFAWGRGNGFAAFGVMDALTHLPVAWKGRQALLEIYRKHMNGLRAYQSPDGSWRQVIDHPGSYRELTATAMITTAIARGIRLGWLDEKVFSPVVERGWRAVSARVTGDGSLVDVCTGTGAKKDCDVSHYLRRDAIFGPDDRGGAMALTAALEIIELKSR